MAAAKPARWADGLYTMASGDEIGLVEVLRGIPPENVPEFLVDESMLTVQEVTRLCRMNSEINRVVCGSSRVWLALLRRDFALAARAEDMVGRTPGGAAIIADSMTRYVLANNAGGDDGVRERARALYAALYGFVRAEKPLPVAASVSRDVRRDANQRFGEDAGRLLLELSASPVVRGDRVNVEFRNSFVALRLCAVPDVREPQPRSAVLLADVVELMFNEQLFTPEWLRAHVIVAPNAVQQPEPSAVTFDFAGAHKPPLMFQRLITQSTHVVFWPPFSESEGPTFERTIYPVIRMNTKALPVAHSPYTHSTSQVAYAFAGSKHDVLFGANKIQLLMSVANNDRFTRVSSVVGDYALLTDDRTLPLPRTRHSAVINLSLDSVVSAVLEFEVAPDGPFESVLLETSIGDGPPTATVMTLRQIGNTEAIQVLFQSVPLYGSTSLEDVQQTQSTIARRREGVNYQVYSVVVRPQYVIVRFGQQDAETHELLAMRPGPNFERREDRLDDVEADRVVQNAALRNVVVRRMCHEFRNVNPLDDDDGEADTSRTKRQRSRAALPRV